MVGVASLPSAEEGRPARVLTKFPAEGLAGPGPNQLPPSLLLVVPHTLWLGTNGPLISPTKHSF